MDGLKMMRFDFLTARFQIRDYLILAFLVILFFSIGSDYLLVVAFLSGWVIALLSAVTFEVQETNSLERYYGTVPLRVDDIVLGRYLSTYALFTVVLLLGIVAYTAGYSYKMQFIEAADIISGASLALLVFSILVGVQTPLFFRRGYLKGRVVSIAILYAILALFLIPVIEPSLALPLDLIETINIYLMPICVAISAVVLFISYRLSIVAYRKRSF